MRKIPYVCQSRSKVVLAYAFSTEILLLHQYERDLQNSDQNFPGGQKEHFAEIYSQYLTGIFSSPTQHCHLNCRLMVEHNTLML